MTTPHTTGTNLAPNQTALQPWDSKSKPDWYVIRSNMRADCSKLFSTYRTGGLMGTVSLDDVVTDIKQLPSVQNYILQAPNKPHARAVVRQIISDGIKSYIDSKDLTK